MTINKKDFDKLLNKLDEGKRGEAIMKGLYEGAQYIAGWVKTNRLSGPRPDYLGVKTGRLRSSIAVSQAIADRGKFTMRIGTNVEYAAIHEFGFYGAVNVREHVRRTGRFKARGASGRLKFAGSTIGFFGGTRNMQMPARPFLTPAIEDEGNKTKVVNAIKRNITKLLEA